MANRGHSQIAESRNTLFANSLYNFWGQCEQMIFFRGLLLSLALSLSIAICNSSFQSFFRQELPRACLISISTLCRVYSGSPISRHSLSNDPVSLTVYPDPVGYQTCCSASYSLLLLLHHHLRLLLTLSYSSQFVFPIQIDTSHITSSAFLTSPFF